MLHGLLSARRIAALLVAGAALPAALAAQDNYEIQVYGAETVAPRTTMVELHSNFTFDGDTLAAGGLRPTEHALHETLEITHGFTPWFEVGFYTFTSAGAGAGWNWVGTHIRPRVRVPASWHWPVGVSLSQEIGYVRGAYDPNTWSWEIRPIVDGTSGRVYWSVNPALEVALAGADAGSAPGFAPAAKIAVTASPAVTVGLEYYGSFGPVTHFLPRNAQEQQLFPSVDLNVAPQWELNAGLGFGLTPATDRLIFKIITGYRLPF